MNEFNRSLLLVLIASAVSTSSYGMAALIGEEDAKRMEQAAAVANTVIVPALPTTTATPQTTPEHLRPASEAVLPGEVSPASMSPRKKLPLEMTVRHESSSDAAKPAALPVARVASGESDDGGYVSASDGRSRDGSAIKKNLSDSALPDLGRPSASVDDFAAAREQVRARKVAAAAAKPVAKTASEEIPAVSLAEKKDATASRESSGPVEEAMLRSRDEKSLTPSAASVLPSKKLDSAAGVDLTAPEARAASPKHESISALMSAATDSSSAAPVPAVDVPAGSAAAQKDSLLAKIKRNKLKTFAIILALAEAADLTHTYFLKTTKEELQDKTLMQKAKLVAQKTYTAKLLVAAKDTALNLKQQFKTFLHKKN